MLTAMAAGTVAAREGKAEYSREIRAYAHQVERKLVLAMYRDNRRFFPGEGKTSMRFSICRSGKVEILSIKGGTPTLRAYIRRQVLNSNFPKPPNPLPECMNITVPLHFWEVR